MGDNCDIDVSGDVDSGISGASAPLWALGDDCFVDIVGDVSRMHMTFGTAGATSTNVTDVNVGTIGANDPIHESWTLQGYADLAVGGAFIARSLDAEVNQSDNSSMTVTGATDDATWNLSDDAKFTATGTITGGEWNVDDCAQVIGNDDIDWGPGT